MLCTSRVMPLSVAFVLTDIRERTYGFSVIIRSHSNNESNVPIDLLIHSTDATNTSSPPGRLVGRQVGRHGVDRRVDKRVGGW